MAETRFSEDMVHNPNPPADARLLIEKRGSTPDNSEYQYMEFQDLLVGSRNVHMVNLKRGTFNINSVDKRIELSFVSRIICSSQSGIDEVYSALNGNVDWVSVNATKEGVFYIIADCNKNTGSATLYVLDSGSLSNYTFVNPVCIGAFYNNEFGIQGLSVYNDDLLVNGKYIYSGSISGSSQNAHMVNMKRGTFNINSVDKRIELSHVARIIYQNESGMDEIFSALVGNVDWVSESATKEGLFYIIADCDKTSRIATLIVADSASLSNISFINPIYIGAFCYDNSLDPAGIQGVSVYNDDVLVDGKYIYTNPGDESITTGKIMNDITGAININTSEKRVYIRNNVYFYYNKTLDYFTGNSTKYTSFKGDFTLKTTGYLWGDLNTNSTLKSLYVCAPGREIELQNPIFFGSFRWDGKNITGFDFSFDIYVNNKHILNNTVKPIDGRFNNTLFPSRLNSYGTNSSGNVVPESMLKTTALIPISDARRIIVTGATSNSYPLVLFYDKNLRYLGFYRPISSIQPTADTWTVERINFPDPTFSEFIRCNALITQDDADVTVDVSSIYRVSEWVFSRIIYVHLVSMTQFGSININTLTNQLQLTAPVTAVVSNGVATKRYNLGSQNFNINDGLNLFVVDLRFPPNDGTYNIRLLPGNTMDDLIIDNSVYALTSNRILLGSFYYDLASSKVCGVSLNANDVLINGQPIGEYLFN